MKPNYYAIITASVRYDKELSPNAKLLYGEITALANQKGYCYATNKYFAHLYDVAEKTISEWIKQLKNRGHIHCENPLNHNRRIYINKLNKSCRQEKLTGPSGKPDGSRRENLTLNTTVNTTENKCEPSSRSSPTTEIATTDPDNWGNETIPSKKKKTRDSRYYNLVKKFVEKCEKELNQRPVPGPRAIKIVSYAMNTGQLSASDIEDLFDWWFTRKDKKDSDLIQITKALSSYTINEYKIDQ